jgi:hypothetical protein
MDGYYKKKLLEFMEEKNKIIKKHTNLVVFTAEDFAEIRDLWSEGDCRFVIKNLYYDKDYACCPWCLVHACPWCLYNKRNGDCVESPNSRYKRILASARIETYYDIVSLPGMHDLVIKYSESKYVIKRYYNG